MGYRVKEPVSGGILKESLEVVPADLDRDRDALISVWERNFPALSAAAHANRFAWYYLANPLGRGRCWFLKTGNGGKVVGTAGIGLRRLVVGGKSLMAGLASDFAVDKEYRSALPALTLQRAVLTTLDQDLELIYALPNDNSLPIFRRLAYQHVGSLQRCVKVLDVRRYLEARSGLAWCAPLVSGPLGLVRRLASRETWFSKSGYALQELSALDERFDMLWERTAQRMDVVTERRAALLSWRYRDCPSTAYKVLGLVRHTDDQLHGYAVTMLGQDHQLRVVDFVADAKPEMADRLLALLLGYARACGASSVALEWFGIPWMGVMLRHFGFADRPVTQPVMCRTRSDFSAEMTGKLPHWYFLRYEEDFN